MKCGQCGKEMLLIIDEPMGRLFECSCGNRKEIRFQLFNPIRLDGIHKTNE